MKSFKGIPMLDRCRHLLLIALVAGLAGCAALPGARSTPDTPDVTATAASSKGPSVQAWRTGDGARVLFIATHELPMVDVQVVFDAGSARDGAQAGLAALTRALLDDGAGPWDADAIAQRLDRTGAQLGGGVDRDRAEVTLRTLRDPELMEPAVETFARVIAEPTFPEAAFERERARMQVGVRERRQSPGGIADEAFYRAVFGDHPYAHPPGGTLDSLSGIGRDDVHAFHQRFYVESNATVAIVGDLDREAAERLAERVVGGLPAGEPAPALPEVEPLEEASTVRESHPSAQTHLLMGQPGVARDGEDYFPLYVGNHALGGGGFISRLMDVVRQEHGLAYSVYSYFQPLARRGPWQAGVQTRNDQVSQARELMRQTIARFVREGPTADELQASKQNIVGGFPLNIDSNSDLVSYIAMIGFYGLPSDYLRTFTDRVEAVSVTDVKQAFQRRIDPDRLATVIVGGAAGADDNGTIGTQ